MKNAAHEAARRVKEENPHVEVGWSWRNYGDTSDMVRLLQGMHALRHINGLTIGCIMGNNWVREKNKKQNPNKTQEEHKRYVRPMIKELFDELMKWPAVIIVLSECGDAAGYTRHWELEDYEMVISEIQKR